MRLRLTIRDLLCLTVVATVMLLLFAASVIAADLPSGQESNQPPTACGISGLVVDLKHDPLSGARVWLMLCDFKTWSYGPPPGISKKQVNAKGEFQFGDLPPGQYVIVAEAEGLAASHIATRVLEGQQPKFEIELRPAAKSVVKLQTESGEPVSGATLRDLQYRYAGGKFFLYSPTAQKLASLGLKAEPSDRDGLLRLPALPEGAVITTAIIDHPDFAPVKIKDVGAKSEQVAAGIMHPGVKLTLKMSPADDGKTIGSARLRLVHHDLENPSSLVDVPISIHEGTATLMIESGEYQVVRLEHDDYVITPLYYPTDANLLEIAPGKNDRLTFTLHGKVQARGRIVLAGGGAPVPGEGVSAEMFNGPASGWLSVAGAVTDADGRYVLSVPSGPVRLVLDSEKFTTAKPFFEAQVGTDGSTVLPDIEVLPLPIIRGRVIDPDGNAVQGAILRLQGMFRHARQPPAVSGADGCFELQVRRTPEDFDIRTPQFLDVLYPTKPLSLRTEVRLDRPAEYSNLDLRLKRESMEVFLQRAKTPTSDTEREWLAYRSETDKSATATVGRLAPELDGALWINAEKPSMNLADFRGRYVLLDFWAVWCGPCHADFPDVKLLYETYKDKGLVVIGVHDNSADADSVRQHAEEQKLQFLVMVDQRDGRTVDAYRKIGAVYGYPNYVLIGPDGKIVQANELASYKFEFIRNHLFGDRPASEK